MIRDVEVHESRHFVAWVGSVPVENTAVVANLSF